jgi:CoA:oxalate CoA-transferase
MLISRIKVVDLGRAFAGPSAGMWLGDLGADVIKIETGPNGDSLRNQSPGYAPDMSGYFCTANRNKRSLRLDLRHPGGRKVLAALLADADVLVENFRPGVLEAMGLDDDTIARDYPRLVALRISAYGDVGPMSARAGVDQLVQGASGLMSITGTPDTGPIRSGIAVCDVIGGLCGAMGVLGALMERETSGKGQIVRTSLLEAMMSTMSVQAGKYFAGGADPGPEGNRHPSSALYGLFETADGHIQIQCTRDEHVKALAGFLGRTDWLDDPRFVSYAARARNRLDVNAIAEGEIRKHATRDVEAFLLSSDIPHGAVLSVAEAFAQPQAVALQMVQAMQATGGLELKAPRPPWRYSRTPTEMRHPVPRLGEHTQAIIDELGLADDPEVRAAVNAYETG